MYRVAYYLLLRGKEISMNYNYIFFVFCNFTLYFFIVMFC